MVIADIITNHNQTIENLYSSIQTNPLARLLPDEPPKVHPTEVSPTTAIVGHFQEYVWQYWGFKWIPAFSSFKIVLFTSSNIKLTFIPLKAE